MGSFLETLWALFYSNIMWRTYSPGLGNWFLFPISDSSFLAPFPGHLSFGRLLMIRMELTLTKQISISNLSWLSFDSVEFSSMLGCSFSSRLVALFGEPSGSPPLEVVAQLRWSRFFLGLGSSSADRILPGVCPSVFVMSLGPSSHSGQINLFVRSVLFFRDFSIDLTFWGSWDLWGCFSPPAVVALR